MGAIGMYNLLTPSAPSRPDYNHATMVAPRIHGDTKAMFNANMDGSSTLIFLAVLGIILAIGMIML